MNAGPAEGMFVVLRPAHGKAAEILEPVGALVALKDRLPVRLLKKAASRLQACIGSGHRLRDELSTDEARCFSPRETARAPHCAR